MKESKAQQILIHALIWETMVPAFKVEAQEAYHQFAMGSENSTVDANALHKSKALYKWPVIIRNQHSAYGDYIEPYTQGGKSYLNF